jgi:hypothetical protein
MDRIERSNLDYHQYSYSDVWKVEIHSNLATKNPVS